MAFLKKKKPKRSSDPKNLSLSVVVESPDKTIWEGKARSVSSKNVDGDFDVLPMHGNFITVLEDEPIYVDSLNEGKKKFSFANAVMYVVNDRVSIYVNI